MLTEKVKSITLENLYSVAKNQRLFVFSRMVLRMFMLILRETLPLTFFFQTEKHTLVSLITYKEIQQQIKKSK